MNKKQEEKFTGWLSGTHYDFVNKQRSTMYQLSHEQLRDGFRSAWQACLEANGIGEDYSNPPNKPCGHESDKPCDCELNREEPRIPDSVVEVGGGHFKIDWNSRPWASEVRVGYASKDMRPDAIGDRIVTIHRPVPAWKPKDGEAVLIRLRSVDDWIAGAGVYDDGKVVHGSQICVNYQIKPFDASKIDKPWSEI